MAQIRNLRLSAEDLDNGALDEMIGDALRNAPEMADLGDSGAFDIAAGISALDDTQSGEHSLVDDDSPATPDTGGEELVIDDPLRYMDPEGPAPEDPGNRVVSETVKVEEDRAAEALRMFGVEPEKPSAVEEVTDPEEPAEEFTPRQFSAPDPGDSPAVPTDMPANPGFESTPNTKDSSPSAVSQKLSSAKGWVTGLSRRTKITAAIVGVAAIVFAATSLTGGDDEATTAGGGGVVVDNGSVSDSDDASDTSSGSGAAGAAPLTDQISDIAAGSGGSGDGCAKPSTDARLAVLGGEKEAWVCGRAGDFDGAILNIWFRNPVTVSSISFIPGYNYVQPSGDDMWEKNRVITSVLWRMGGKQVRQEVVPSREPATLTLDTPITTQSMSMTIQSSVNPDESVGSDSGAAGVFGQESSSADNATAVQSLTINGTVN